MKIKKIIAVALSLCLVGGALPVSAAAADNEGCTMVIKGDLIYLKYSDHAELLGHSKIGEEYDANIDIPAKIDGVPVTAVGYGLFANHDEIVSVKLPDTITYIGASAFAGCSNLTSVNIPSELSEIGSYAFANCKKLKSVSIPSGLKVVYEGVFCCTGLTSVRIPEGTEDISYSAFAGCSELTSVDIPSSVDRIGALAFNNCTNLKSIAIANSNCSIYDEMFTICTYETSLFDGNVNELKTYIKDNGIKTFTGTIYGHKDSAAQAYAEKYGYDFVGYSDGDLDGDGAINALDASYMLIEYSSLATGKDTTFNSVQNMVADVNRDSAIDALDASDILRYYSFIATGGSGSIDEYLGK